ncbi:MAG TPA: cyclic nucleotide-binding domain-containing protein [Candidatus Limnocylindrales bacterium]|nr:cyclic nucleotide-binding domain-containing protein [Candidatus Limnocylindrales bacterium]
MDDKVALLRAVPLFAELDDRSLQAIATLAREVDARAGDVVMREGESGESFLVIVEGTLRVEQAGRDIRSMMAGGFLGEIALLEHGPRTATATCVTDCRLLSLGHFEFDRLMATFPDVRT